MKSKLTIVLTSVSLLFISTQAFSQDGGGGGGDAYLDDSFRDISLVGATAAGGALLGASTLSFVEEPGDHLKNILVGAAIGVIIGVGMVAFMAATKNKERFEEANLFIDPDKDLQFATTSRMKWHSTQHNSYNTIIREPSALGYQFTF